MDDDLKGTPTDEYHRHYVATKVEARKIFQSPRFEAMAAKYWQLLRNDPSCDLSKTTVSKAQYCGLMRRMYKVLLPLYRQKEMDAEIEDEWLLDCSGQPELTLHLFTKLLFRVAHYWATHIDLDEYLELLGKIFDRITCKLVTRAADGSAVVCNPTVTCQIIPDPDGESPFGSSSIEDAMWEPCASDEEDDPDFDYCYVEDPEAMTVRKHKQRRVGPEDESAEGDMEPPPIFSVKEAVHFREDVVYYQNSGDYRPRTDDVICYQLAKLEDVLPFGYPTEQFLTWLKNDVYTKLEDAKKARKEALARMKREVVESGGTMREAQLKKEEDSGLVRAQGRTLLRPFDILSDSPTFRVRAKARIIDTLYNAIRAVIKDTRALRLRLHMAHPKASLRNGATKSRAPLGGFEPATEINKFGYNPALERRVTYKQVPLFSQGGKQQFVNITYMYAHPDYETAYRCDVERVEHSDKLAIKANEEFQRDEDFVPVETPFKKMRQIMLTKKFETLYTENLNADDNDRKRMDKIFEKEEQRRRQVRNPEPLETKLIDNKLIGETYEPKSEIKERKGVFYQLVSRDGIKEDDFVTCAQQDLIDYATTRPARVLLMGKPRSGKTTLAKILATRLDLVHISVENWLARLQEKIKAYEPPDDLEEGQEPPKWLSDLEEGVDKALKEGGGPTHEQNVAILVEEMCSAAARTRGCILDLTFYKGPESWAKIIRNSGMLGGPDSAGKRAEFSHVIELDCDDDEARLRAEHMRLDPEDGVVYSRWERAERNKPRPKQYDEDGNEIEEEEPEGGWPKLLLDSAMVERAQDTETFMAEELMHYGAMERPAMDDLLVGLFNNQYLKLDSAGLVPEELADAAEWRLRPDETIPLRPVAKQLEGGAGNFKDLLTEPLFEDQPEGTLPRTWSLWRQMDPVALFEGKVIPGAPENAVAYANNMFAFATEENMQAFVKEPSKYLQAAPQMPSSYRLLMLGPKGIGVHTQAAKLHEKYGWQVVDYQQLVKTRLEKILREEVHLPNNVVPALSAVGLSQAEIDQIKSGKPFPASRFVPWVLDHLGYELMKRPPPPAADEGEGAAEEDLDEETKAKLEKERKKKEAEEAKKAKEEEEARKAKEERKKRRAEAIANGEDLAALGLEESEEEEVKVEDLSIEDLVLKVDEETGKAPSVGGFILLGFPQTELHVTKLKEHGIEFDRILYLTDPSEEDAGKSVKERMCKRDLHYDWDAENEQAQKVLGIVKEHLGEEITREIAAGDSVDEVAIRIQAEIDPFFTRVDNPEDVRVSADLDEEAKRLPKGDFGDFCPVTYVTENWLVKGNPELEATVHGKTYVFAGEKELEEFKFNPAKFMVSTNQANLPLKPPPPKIMVLGMKGSGVTTQIRLLREKYKLEEFLLKDQFLGKMKTEKEARKRRRLLDRGFRPPPPPDDDQEGPVPDPEIEDDPEDFDKEAHERDLLRLISDSNQGVIIDGTWTGFPEDSVTALEGGAFGNLLLESRRAPELVVMLKCKEPAAFERMIDADAVKAEFDQLMAEREAARKKQREEDRAAKLAEVEEGLAADEEKTEEEKEQEKEETMAKWDEERDAEDEAADEDDPEKPNLEDMMEKLREGIRTQREADEAFLEEFGTLFKEKGVPVIDNINTDTSADFVFVKLVDQLKEHFQMREDLIERQQAQPLNLAELPFYEQSFTYKQSKFGRNSPLSLSNPVKTRNFTVLYRERIYYLSDEDERSRFLLEPSKYTKCVESVPLDVQVVPRVLVLGLPKSGKSTLCQTIASQTGAVHLQMDEIIGRYMEKDSAQCEKVRMNMKGEGRCIDDTVMVTLLAKRLQAKDCLANGWVLEDFPRTKQQAIQMASRGVLPPNVFHLRLPVSEVYKRTEALKDSDFGSNRTILAQRLRYLEANLPHVASFYQRVYNSLLEIDAMKSKWFMEDRAMTAVENNLRARQMFARSYCHGHGESRAVERPCELKDLHCDRALFKTSLSQFGYYCPVTWKNTKQLVKCTHNPENCVLYENVFYYFQSPAEKEMFLTSPLRFVNQVIFSSEKGIPRRLKPPKAAEIVAQKKVNTGHCPGALVDEARVSKGDQLLIVQYKEQKFAFESEYRLQKFMRTPGRYYEAKLPVKMPPHEDPVSLYTLQGYDESTTFIEQALGSIVTRGLREVSENRLKYPNLSVKETMLKLFALFLKAENPANTQYMKDKYLGKMRQFIERCEMAEELSHLAEEKEQKQKVGKWAEFKEKYYNELGAKYDEVLKVSLKEKANGFQSYIR